MTAEDRSKMSVMLTCQDMQASVRFYRDQLGFEMKESWPSDDAPMWANMMLGGQSVMLGCAVDPADVGKQCAGDPAAERVWTQLATDYQENKHGVGIQVYVMVDDIDAYAAEIKSRGVACEGEPKSQFYGIRELVVNDPSGYRLVLFSPITMTSCQSCGMPLSDAAPGQMYCASCTDEAGKLKPFGTILEGTITGYFMGMQKLPRDQAEAAAKEHLAKMPAWAHGAAHSEG